MWPIWFKFLEQRERERGFALTVPFLIGAARLGSGSPAGQPPFAELLALLVSMRDETPASDYVRISECDRLRQPVVNKMSSYFDPGVGFADLPSPVRGTSLLFVQAKYLANDAHVVERLTGNLWSLCGSAISDGRFTFKNGHYREFSQEDKEFISRAISISDDEG